MYSQVVPCRHIGFLFIVFWRYISVWLGKDDQCLCLIYIGGLWVCFREMREYNDLIILLFDDKGQMGCDRCPFFHRHDRAKAIPLHKGNYLLQIFELIEGGDVHVVKLVD